MGFAVRLAAAALLLLVVGARSATAQSDRPLWALQGFGFAAWTPDYPGSNQNHLHALGGPWLAYNGSVLRTGQIGEAEAVAVDIPRLELDLSASGSFPVDSNHDAARLGMPSLDWMGEVGPRARFNLYYWQDLVDDSLARLSIEMPVRATVSTNLSSRLNYRGWLAAPALTFESNGGYDSGAGFAIGVGPTFIDSRLADYFYGVAPQYATVGRPAYTARGGYLGSTFHLRAEHRVLGPISLFGVVNASDYSGAANSRSPLMLQSHNETVVLGLSVTLYQSATPAPPR